MAIPDITLLTSDAIGIAQMFLGPQWGIYLDTGTTRVPVVGQGVNNILTIITGTGSGNFLEMDYRLAFNISDYPVEQGSFQSYNKVQRPYQVSVAVTAGGTEENRALLLSQVQAIIDTTNLYTVVMPEGGIVGLNPVGFTFSRRSDRGLGLLTIEIFFQQVRPAGDPTFSTTNTAATTPNAAPTTGTVTPITSPTAGFVTSTSQQVLGVVSPVVAGLAVTNAVSLAIRR
jgi:hypothetical protein